MFKPYLLLVYLLFSSGLFGQEIPTADDFTASGDTRLTGENCYQLTNAINWSGGSVWYNSPIDLGQPFKMELKMMLGCQDASGADGMVLVFHPNSMRNGRQGEGMGFSGLRPSIGIEIDTWLNEHLGDTYQDHVAILKNGRPDHYSNLAGPNPIQNIEDCRQHRVVLSWAPTTQKLRMQIDGKEVISYTGDIVQDIFYGNPTVYWGVTAATGQYNNRQQICFEKLEITKVRPPAILDRLSTRKLIRGEALILPKIQFASGQAKPDEDGFAEMDKLLKVLNDYPEMAIEIAAYTDSSGKESGNRRISDLRAKALRDYLIAKGISKKRIYAYGYGEANPIASNGTPEGRNKNRRVEFKLFRLIP